MLRRMTRCLFGGLLPALILLSACGDDQIAIPDPSNTGDSGTEADPGRLTDANDSGEGDALEDAVGNDIATDLAGDTVEVDEAPRLVNAFSRDGEEIVSRFSEEIDTGSGAAAENYRVVGSDNSELPVTSVAVDGRFAFLSLDLSSATINPDLTYEVVVRDVFDTTGNSIDTRFNRVTVKQALYLNIIWH